MSERRKLIEATVKDLVSDFLYYDRKEDEALPLGTVEDAIASGEIRVRDLYIEGQNSGEGRRVP